MASTLFTRRTGASLAAVLLGAALPAAEPRLEKMDLFEAGKGGHKLYRIPGLVVTAGGTVLAYCEARKHTGLDWDDIEPTPTTCCATARKERPARCATARTSG
jgi:hypothetical protein